MCCRRKQERLALAPVQPRQRGCCNARRQKHLRGVADVNWPQQEVNQENTRGQRPTMAALLAVGIGIGAEKLGRKISDKRLERKEKKAAMEREAIYGAAGSSSSAVETVQDGHDRNEKKREEARRELHAAREEQHGVPRYSARRRSTSEERLSEDEPPPPRYEDVVRQGARRS